MVEHVDPEVLALIALGQPMPDDADRVHVAGCGKCAAEVSSLAAVVAIGRTATAVDALVAPPPSVWERIRDELQLAPVSQAATADRAQRDRGDLRAVPSEGPTAAESTAAEQTAAEQTAAEQTRVPAIPRRSRAPWIAAAAATGLIVGGTGGALLVSGDGSPAPVVVAQAALEPLPGQAASGTALVEKEPGGTRVLVVTLDGGQQSGDFREVWLIDSGVQRLVSLGVLEGSTGRFTVPDGLDLSEYPIVDISQEPYDGVPAHSGDSIVRGTLGA